MTPPTEATATGLKEAIARAAFEADPDVGVSWDDWVAYALAHPDHQQSVDFVRRQATAILALLPSASVGGEREAATSVDDEVTRAFIDGWNARLDHSDFDMALHYWMLSSVRLAAPETPPTEGEPAVGLPGAGEVENLRARLVAAEHAALKWEQACQQSWDREALATVAAANDEGERSARMREAIDAGLRAFCADTSDFTMSSAMRRAAADFIMGEPSMFPLATSGSQHEGAE